MTDPKVVKTPKTVKIITQEVTETKKEITMVKFDAPVDESDIEISGKGRRVDYAPYIEYMRNLNGKVGKINLGANEKKLTIQNHVRGAAKILGHEVVFLSSGKDGPVYFKLT